MWTRLLRIDSYPRAKAKVLGRDHLIRTVIESKVAKYPSRLPPELLAGINGNRLSPAPLWLVGGEPRRR
jgi:hypothetical protein